MAATRSAAPAKPAEPDVDAPEADETGTNWDSLLDNALIETRASKKQVEVPERVQKLVDGAFANNNAITLPVGSETEFDELKNILSCAADASEHKISVYCKKLTDNNKKLTHLKFTVGKRRGNNPNESKKTDATTTASK